jgi:calcium-dependent protein kinase
MSSKFLKGEYVKKCNIWSIGAMKFLILYGDPPFNGSSNNEIFKKLQKKN